VPIEIASAFAGFAMPAVVSAASLSKMRQGPVILARARQLAKANQG
jgi:hypothetical protein